MIKQVIVMRTDLGMRKGKMIAQGSHASMKVFFDRAKLIQVGAEPEMLVSLWPEAKAWIEGIFTKICVAVDSEAELLKIKAEADAARLPCALIQDAGRTEFHGVPTNTCLAVGPADSETIDKITGSLRLL
jgi:peptidyl-tRNA hydrolase